MQKPLRIAIFTSSFPSVSETFILRQITGLIDLGHEVDIYADARGEGLLFHPDVEKYNLLERTTYVDAPPASIPWEIPVLPESGETWLPGAETAIPNQARLDAAQPHLERCRSIHPALTEKILKREEYSYRALSLSMVYRMSALARGGKAYDVLHAHFGPVGTSYHFARELWNAPFIVSFHGYDFSTVPRREGRNTYDKLFDTADAVTVNSDYTREQLIKLGCPVHKLRKLPVGLNPEEFAFHDRKLDGGEPIRILTVARLVEIKGVEFVIRAVAKLHKVLPNIRYDIIGDGPLRPKLQALICELGLEALVTLHGAKAGNDVKKAMADAHLFVLTSVTVEGDREGQGLVLQEAQACGIPVVCTNHGAFPEGMLCERSGFLVPERDVDALADRLHWLIDQSERWPEIGRVGREYAVRHYDMKNLNQLLVGIYEETIARFR